jgi:glycosyltransferase involved in cell wall biosynthesis
VLHPEGQAMTYPIEVQHRIRKDVASDYPRTARSLNDCVDVVSIQHEYGIWGGADGEHVLDFAGALRIPSVATLHTVLPEPTARQRAVLSGLVAMTDATVVMSHSAAGLLASAYGVDPGRVHIIPHGVPNLPLVDPETVKSDLGVAGRDVILSFGLLGPGKGLELAIEALPAVVAAHPSVLYVILGATHPDLVRREGETYRRSLVDQVGRLGMAGHVHFIDRFAGRVELTHWLEAADIFVTPYPNLAQIVSGTLSYAMAAGRAIVSTPYAYAAELLADGRGVLVPPGSAAGLGTAMSALLSDPLLRAATGRRAWDYSRAMVWSAVGAEYSDLLGTLARRAASPVPLGRLVPASA